MRKPFMIVQSYCFNPVIVDESAVEWSMVYIGGSAAKSRPLTAENARAEIDRAGMTCVTDNKYGRIYEMPGSPFARYVKDNDISIAEVLRN